MMVWLEACRSPVQASCLLVLKVLLVAQPFVCPSPQTGVLVGGTWLVSVNSKPLYPQGFQTQKTQFLGNLHPKRQTLSSPELHQSHQQTFPFSLPLDSLHLSHSMIFSSSFPTQKLQTHCSFSTSRFQPGSRRCFERLPLAACVHCLGLLCHWISWLSVWG